MAIEHTAVSPTNVLDPYRLNISTTVIRLCCLERPEILLINSMDSATIDLLGSTSPSHFHRRKSTPATAMRIPSSTDADPSSVATVRITRVVLSFRPD